ncbi:ester cyclase [Sphingosinicellaceae bacterium]|nr:ester cyclase [Sphingosinicellaceae bacterium]
MILGERKRRLAEFLETVWSLGDVEACDHFVGANYTVRHDPGDPWHGRTLDREGFKDRVRTSRAPFPDQRFHVAALLEDDGKVAVAWTWTATHQGDIPGFPATGQPLAMSGLTVYDFDAEGLITGHWQVSDRLGVYGQLQAARQAGPA